MDYQIKITSYLSTIEIDNKQGSTKYCSLTSVNGRIDAKCEIELSANSGRVEINGVELTSEQRKVLIKFLKQKD